MSALTRPSGPLPARVYWTRRGLVLVVALLLVFATGKVLGGGSDGKGEGDATAEAASGEIDSEPRETRATERATQSTQQRQGKKRAKAPLASPDGPCDPADITITPVIGTVANDGSIDYRVAVTGAEPACTWTFSQQTVALKITSGSDEVWSSQQCRTLPNRDIVVRSAVERRIALTWDGRRSDDGCTDRRGWARPGYYHVVVAALGGEPSDGQFRLTRPPTEVVTVTPKPEPKPKKKASDKPSATRRG